MWAVKIGALHASIVPPRARNPNRRLGGCHAALGHTPPSPATTPSPAGNSHEADFFPAEVDVDW